MRERRVIRCLKVGIPLLISLITEVPSHGQSESDAQQIREILAPRLFDELFDTILPGQYEKGEWSLRLRPKFGDFVDDDYVRLLTGVRYNFSNYFDAYTDAGTYFVSPFGDGSGAGFYTWRVGARYTWYGVGDSHINLAMGINARFPLSTPPPELSDGHARYAPYLTVSRQLEKYPNWLLYLSTTYQIVADAPFRRASSQPMPKDRLFLRPGAIYYPGGNFRYSLELEYRTNVLDFDKEEDARSGLPPNDVLRNNWILAHREIHELILYPGVTWFPTVEVREGFWIPGNWDVGMQLKIPVMEETDQSFGVTIRFRWFYDYGAFIRNKLPNFD